MKNKRKGGMWLGAVLLAVLLMGNGCAVRPEAKEEPAASAEAAYAETNYAEKTGTETVGNEETGEAVIRIELPEETSEAVVQETSQTLDAQAEQYCASMSVEEKVAQMFIVLPESLMDGVSCVVAAGETTREAIREIPVGGFVYLSSNLQSEDQVRSMLSGVQQFSMERSNLPAFLCVDEEGGTVTRIAQNENFHVRNVGDMSAIGETGDPNQARKAGEEIGTYLAALGFNVDFAPVADVLTNPENRVIGRRSFGTDAELVSEMAQAFSDGLNARGVLSSYKHFPGHGATAGDTHEGYAYTDKTLDELKACELIPFQNGVETEVPFIMIGHISLPGILGDHTPASLSSEIITGLLREDMGYDGVVITDALNMGAITQQYTSAEAAVKAVQAGADIILMPADFKSAYRGVVEAVRNGTIPEARIDESLMRILRLKIQM